MARIPADPVKVEENSLSVNQRKITILVIWTVCHTSRCFLRRIVQFYNHHKWICWPWESNTFDLVQAPCDGTIAIQKVHQSNNPTLTRNLHGKSVAADANKVESHTLDRHPAGGPAHGEDALHLHGPELLPLDLHCGGLERDGHLQPWGVFIAPASLQNIYSQTNVLPL